jgi:hypothetical protein
MKIPAHQELKFLCIQNNQPKNHHSSSLHFSTITAVAKTTSIVVSIVGQHLLDEVQILLLLRDLGLSFFTSPPQGVKFILDSSSCFSC